MEIISRSAVEFIRANAGMYLPSGGAPIGVKLAGLLVGDALVLGASDIRIVREGEWFCISADQDWLAIGSDMLPVPELFCRLAALPEAGQNSVRHEVVVAAFSQAVVTISPSGEVVPIVGDSSLVVSMYADKMELLSGRRVIFFKRSL